MPVTCASSYSGSPTTSRSEVRRATLISSECREVGHVAAKLGEEKQVVGEQEHKPKSGGQGTVPTAVPGREKRVTEGRTSGRATRPYLATCRYSGSWRIQLWRRRPAGASSGGIDDVMGNDTRACVGRREIRRALASTARRLVVEQTVEGATGHETVRLLRPSRGLSAATSARRRS